MPSNFVDHAALTDYYSRLQAVKSQGFENESQTQRAFSYLLTSLAEEKKWTFVAETPVAKGKRVDGTIYLPNGYPHGHWEAKDEKDDLAAEIGRKIAIGYPTNNTIFEDTKRAVLFQHGRETARFDLTRKDDLGVLLQRFFEFRREDVEGFESAMRGFSSALPSVAGALKTLIETEYGEAPTFRKSFDSFFDLCKSALNPQIKREAVEELLIQHLLTERLFRITFKSDDWVRRNAIAREVESVIQALTGRKFSRGEFFAPLDHYYTEIEKTGATIENFGDRQHFLNTVYERFFQGYSTDTADTMGIVYTPQPIVDWMCASVEKVLSKEWGKSLSDKGVPILDPCTGTGNFLVNIMGRISPLELKYKYENELFASEIMLLPYYIAAANLEYHYFQNGGEGYHEFEGLCFADTLDLFKGAQMAMFSEENSERVAREMAAPITVVIGNPPYNVGQKNENDNNKNRAYPKLDGEIRKTYAKQSKATLQNKLYDPYVRFFKWASERLNGGDGVVCFVTNNSFVDQFAFDGMRSELSREFNHIWHLDLHGNVRKNPKLSGTTHNAFGIQVGVGITILVRNSQSLERFIRYHRVPEDWRRIEKLEWLSERVDLDGIEWKKLIPNSKNAWITEGLEEDFETLSPLGNKTAKASFSPNVKTLFRTYSCGVVTARDSHVYDFERRALVKRVKTFIEIYNSVLNHPKSAENGNNSDSLVDTEDERIKWSRQTKALLKRGVRSEFSDKYLRPVLYRPFCKKWHYFDDFWNEERYEQPRYFPTIESKNLIICLTNVACNKPFHAIMSDCIEDYHLTGDSQCFPLYTFTPDGEMRSDNITPWAVEQFGGALTREEIFYATYALLHHPTYRTRYAENLKRELPRIPTNILDANELARIGRALGDMHVNFENAPELESLKIVQAKREKGVPLSYRVEIMKWNKEKTQLVVNTHLTLSGFTPDMFEYRLGNRSALDWLVESFRVKKDARSGLESDPNRAADPPYILRLVRRVAGISLETQRLISELPTWPTVADAEI